MTPAWRMRLTGPMLMVGLTGGIGAGKSAVLTRITQLGGVAVDADALAREVVEPGTAGLAEVVAAFGTGVLRPDGSLDRAALGRIVFTDEASRRRLESIIHPRVRARTAELVARAAPDAVVVNDVPLLVEAGLAGTFDLVIVVVSDQAIRLRRLVDDRGMAESEAHARIDAQATDDQRGSVADVVIANDGSLEELYAQVDEVWRTRLAARG
jgi:dephospho-CoA kinase